MFGRDEGGIGQQHNAPNKGGQLLVDDVVVLEVLLQLVDIVNLNNHAQAFAGEQEEGIDQGLGGLAADVGFLPFVVLLHVLVGQAFDLFVCELHADGLFGLAGRNKDGQLFAFCGDVVGCEPEIRCPSWCGSVRRGLQQLHDFVKGGLLVLCLGHGYICVFSFQ